MMTMITRIKFATKEIRFSEDFHSMFPILVGEDFHSMSPILVGDGLTNHE